MPLFYPIYFLDYVPYYDQFSSFSLYPNQAIAFIFIFVGIAFLGRSDSLQPLPITIPLLLLSLLTLLSTFTAQVDGRLAAIQLDRTAIDS